MKPFVSLFFLAKYLDAFDKLKPALIKSFNSFFNSNSLNSEFTLGLSIPFITIVISPIISLSLNDSITLSMLLFICSSYFLVNSLPIEIFLESPQKSLNSIKSLFNL